MQTLKEIDTVLKAFWNFNAIYIAHDYVEQDSYRDGSRIYYPLKCETCGHISEAWREF